MTDEPGAVHVRFVFDSDTLNSFIQQIQAFGDRDKTRAALEESGYAVGNQITAYTKQYPPYQVVPRPLYYTRYTEDGKPYKSKWKTEKQERWFFWALGSGELELPYRQTGQAGASMTVLVTVDNEGLNADVTVGAKEPYAVYLFGAERGPGDYVEGMQSAYHRDKGWLSFETMIRDNSQEIEQVWWDTLREHLDNMRAAGAYHA